MRHLNATLLIVSSLIACPSPSFAATPPKAGAECVKKGISVVNLGKKYTCIQLGKKLVWDKGYATSKAPSTPISTPLPKSEPSKFKTKEITFIEKKLAELSQSLPQIQVPEYSIEVEPADQGSVWAKASVKDVKTGTRFIKALGGELPKSTNLLVFSDFDWAKRRMSGTCLNWGMNSLGGQCASDVAFINLGWLKRNGYKANDLTDPWLKINLSSVLSSRVAHIAQSEVFYKATGSYGTGDLNSIPAWMSMGKLQLFIVMNYSLSTNTPYSQVRADWVKSWGNRCTNISLYDLSESAPYENGCENINGYLAMELLLYKTGELNSFYWWESRSSGSLKEGFKKSYDLDLNSFLTEADGYVKSQYI